MRTRRLLTVSVVVLISTMAACGDDGDDEYNPVNRSDDGASAAGGDPASDLPWEDCLGGMSCTTIEVPLDHDAPDGPTIELGVSMVPARGERQGALFVNPGGPGGETTDMPGIMSSTLPAEVTEQFDIVAVDPRGMGENLMSCGYDWTELYGVDHSPSSPEETTELLTTSQTYVDGCMAGAGEEALQQMGTRVVAQDMDLVREAIGDDQLNYLGYSYGTVIGQVYADLFPENVRSMVLDGVVELGVTGPETARAQAEGFEVALASFAETCNEEDWCPIAPDSLAAVEELIDQVETEPIPASPRDLGPGELQNGLAMPLYSENMWPTLASAVGDALDGDGTAMVGLADEYLALANFDVYFAVNCLDFEWPDDPEQLLSAAADSGDVAPHFGESLINDYVRCSMWPVESEPLEPVEAPDAPTILVVSTTNDPATPHQAGIDTADRLANGTLLTYEGDQHGVVGYGVPCIDDAFASYVVDLEAPPEGTIC